MSLPRASTCQYTSASVSTTANPEAGMWIDAAWIEGVLGQGASSRTNPWCASSAESAEAGDPLGNCLASFALNSGDAARLARCCPTATSQ